MGDRLPVVSGQQAIAAFTKAGWVVVRQRGSHIMMSQLGNPITLSVPAHSELDRGLLRKLIRHAGLSVEQFIDLL